MKNNKKYIKTNDGHIFKMTSNSDIFLKVSPYSMNEDRRIIYVELLKKINNNEASFINKNKALEDINSLWRDYEKEWVYNGNCYKIKKEHFCFNKAKEHRFLHRYTNVHGEESTFHSIYFLCMFHGKLCWVQHSHYYPQMQIYKFIDLETEPSYDDFIQWTNIKNLKNIYWKNYEGKWVVI